MRIKKLAALALSAVAAAAVSLSVPAGAAGAATSAPLSAVASETEVDLAAMPPLEAVFNNPLPKGTAGYDRTIEGRLLDLIGKATSRSSIRVSLYELEDEDIVNALISARRNDADVQVLSERCPWGSKEDRCGTVLPQASRLAQALGNLPDGTPRVVQCEMGCMQTKDINHDKFWLFSELSDGETKVANVAVQSSHNLGATTAGLADNMVISAGDAQIYQGYEHTWNTMRAKELAGEAAGLWPEVDIAGTGDFSGHAGTVSGWRYPRVAKSGEVINDPVARSITALDCATGPEVHIAMASWGGRVEVDKALAAKVDEVGANGKRCKFRILTAGTPKLAADLEPNAAHPDRDVQLWTVTLNQLNGASGGLHSKYVLLSWDDADGAHRVVHTGSDNFSNPAVTTADESSLRITDPRIYNDFKANWDLLRAQNDLTANNLTDIPFLYEYSSRKTAQPFTFGTTEFGTFRNPKHPPSRARPRRSAARRSRVTSTATGCSTSSP